MSFEETALSFWQLCHHSLACFLLSSNSCLWPLSSMQLEVGRVGKVWAANCGFSDVTCCAGLRQFLTKNQVKVHTQVSSNAGRVKCSTLMKTGATILLVPSRSPSCDDWKMKKFSSNCTVTTVSQCNCVRGRCTLGQEGRLQPKLKLPRIKYMYVSPVKKAGSSYTYAAFIV